MTTVSAIPEIAPAAANRDRTTRSKYPRLRLHPIVPLLPGLPIHSWLGGTPHMPADMPWPIAGGKPALFLAQISCAHLPPRLWGKHGPRAGWLLAFTPQDNPGAPILRHIAQFGIERQPPGPLHYPTTPPMRIDILARATGTPAAIPRWPIEITADDRPLPSADPDTGQDTDQHTDQNTGQNAPPDAAAQTDLSDPRYQPFDWGSAMVLLDSLHTELDWHHRVVDALLDPSRPDANTLHYLDSLSRTRDSTATLRTELAAARDQGPAFSPAPRDLALRGLSSLTLDTTARCNDGLQTPVTAPLLSNTHMRQSYFRWFDHYARRLYTDRPEDLPEPQRSLFVAHWSCLAQAEYGEMGGEPCAEAPQTMTVLRLPTSHLMGWSFGASGEFHISLPAEGLSAGSLDIGGDSLPTAEHLP